MKKSIIVLSILALVLTATPAFAKNGKDKDNRGDKRFSKIFRQFGKRIDNNIDATKFVLTGTVASKTTASLVVTTQTTVHVPSLTNSLATVNVDANTKINGNSGAITIADILVGDKVIVMGNVSGTTLTATNVQVNTVKTPEAKKKAFGEVTAKTTTDGVTSVTVKNNVTGITQSVTVDENTKVVINGETKAVADIAVGDRGWVKFRDQAGTMIAKIFSLFR
jgi:hypothetical protein